MRCSRCRRRARPHGEVCHQHRAGPEASGSGDGGGCVVAGHTAERRRDEGPEEEADPRRREDPRLSQGPRVGVRARARVRASLTLTLTLTLTAGEGPPPEPGAGARGGVTPRG